MEHASDPLGPYDAAAEDALAMGTDSGGSQGADAGSAEPDAGSIASAQVRLAARSVQHCAVDPPATPGLARATPNAARTGILKVELLRERTDPSPVELTLPGTLVEVDLVAGGLVAEGAVPAGTYRWLRYWLAYGSVTVAATAHSGGQQIAGALEFDLALAAYQDGDGQTHAPGEMIVRFDSAYAQFSQTTVVPLDCPLSVAGGLVETGWGSHRISVPMPGGPLVVAAGDPPRELQALFPLAGAVTWRDLEVSGFRPEVLDLALPSTAGEIPARLPACDLLLSDRCAEGARPARLDPAWPMPDSATTVCTDGAVIADCPAAGQPGAGQDGTYAIHPTGYRVDGDVVEDSVTGLLWQRGTSPQALDWWQARDYCDDLVLGGRDDWSLPSRLELVSLLDVGRLGPSIDLEAFPDAPSDFFWTASPAMFSSLAFGVRFDEGFVYDHDPRESGRVRCVAQGRAGPTPRFSVAAETATDSATGLTWQRGTLPAQSWLDALASCEALELDGAGDWRMPTLKELLTIVDERALNPSIDVAAFPLTPAEWLWASSPGLCSTDYGWTVSFTDGYCTPAAATQLYLTRCVRGP
ncbi:MAG: DUF1566 domain-containing protein [Deltaproteobacteria bacterium]|nr:DUF1566 domain-containing protein [Deltaproteobacteria bacterium]